MVNIVNKWNMVLSLLTISTTIFITLYPNNKDYTYFLMYTYVLVNTLRSIHPKRDVENICLNKSKFSSVLIGRSIATVAEISFIVLLTIYYNKIANNKYSAYTKLIIAIIIISEIFSWLGCTTKNQIYNTLEESGWALSFIIFSVIVYQINSEKPSDNLRFQLFCYVLFVVYLLAVDIPMYYKRWENSKKKYLSISQGIDDIKNPKLITNDYNIWKQEMIWQTGYFFFASWYSIYIYFQINR